MKTLPAISYPDALPVSAHRDELLRVIGDHQVVVVAGETGSGKTTQLPKICLELGRGMDRMIGHTQPRRIAARTVAERIASELDVELGTAVGYAIRFSDRSSPDTLIRLMTDGLLLAEVRRDRLLKRYDTIIVDEAHERSLNIDFLLGYLVRILPKRPDLKVIVTSATIDPERFARHFGEDTPVVEVSGRTYPVETRYRPLDDDSDQEDGIALAVDELMRKKRGDILIFLSGEREIRDTTELLQGRLPNDVELLPLYARLSSSEQQRIFKPHDKRRIVLATNVAETSLTVPGIKYVIDPGTARISRYSARLKVQRLPIEPISRASADQRKGRCGRTSDGICIRLYSEEDFEERPRFTDPEILRTSLAAVILQMASIGLGSVEDFPFLDPPDARQVRDGLNLLRELGAIEQGRAGANGPRLTGIGRKLAQLPVDPRMARMVVEAERRHCMSEVIVIAAALSIQDPRERPTEFQAQADQSHARFADENSDFLAYLNLWRYLREGQRSLSGNQFRKRCKADYLHYLRVREWQDLVGQLRQAAKQVDLKLNHEPAEPIDVHRAVLSGLLSHIGLKDVRGREYLGARGARFAIFPGSSLARRTPNWVMVAELVETSRLWGRTAARIEPLWIEPLAGHLVKRQYSEPHWERKRASVVATERVTLYGLPVVTDRKVAYGKIDPVVARELFIRTALVEGDWDTKHPFFEENRSLLEEAGELEERARRRDIVVSDERLHDFYDERIPADVVSGAHFDRWYREQDPSLLVFPRELLVTEAAAELDPRDWPNAWKQGDHVLPLSYSFEPGAEHDGVTVHVPLTLLTSLRPDGFEWLVPGLRRELVEALLRGLPKDVRRRLVPIPDVADDVLAVVEPRRAPVQVSLARALDTVRHVSVAPSDFDLGALPPHLRTMFRVEDSDGSVVAEGYDLRALRGAAAPRLRAELASQTSGLERSGLTEWTIGTLPRTVEAAGVTAYPALADEGSSVGVRVLETAAAQSTSHWAGTRRLILLSAASPARWVTGQLGNAAQLALAGMPDALDDAIVAASDVLMAEAGGPAWDSDGFARLRGFVAGELAERTLAIVRDVVAVLDAARSLRLVLDSPSAPELQPARLDVARQLGGLVYPGFVAATGAARLPDLVRYLQAAERRLERLPSAPAQDRDRMAVVNELEDEYRARRDALPDRGREVRWMLEELRVSQFAQGLGVRGSVSAKRIRRALAVA